MFLRNDSSKRNNRCINWSWTPVLPWCAHWPQVEWRASVECYAPAHTCGWTPVPLFPVREPKRRMSRTEEPMSVRGDRRESPWQETVLSRAALLWINESMEHHWKRCADLCVMVPWICPLSLLLSVDLSLSLSLSVYLSSYRGFFKDRYRTTHHVTKEFDARGSLSSSLTHKFSHTHCPNVK